MSSYLAFIHKDATSDFGVSFPDVPGCVSAGRTMAEALRNAQEALSGHLALLRHEGDPAPQPRSPDAIAADPACADDLTGAVLALVQPRVVAAPKIRVNVTFDPEVLRAVDDAAARRGLNRSAFLEQAALTAVGATRKHAGRRG